VSLGDKFRGAGGYRAEKRPVLTERRGTEGLGDGWRTVEQRKVEGGGGVQSVWHRAGGGIGTGGVIGRAGRGARSRGVDVG